MYFVKIWKSHNDIFLLKYTTWIILLNEELLTKDITEQKINHKSILKFYS